MFGAEAFPKMTTGTDLVPASSRMLTTTNGSVVEPMSPMDSIREMFMDMRDSLQAIVENTLETNELLKVGVLGTPAQQRDEAIASGETDAPPIPDEDDDGGPGFLQRLSDRVTGMGTFGKFLVAIGALVGLKLFGDELVPSLAKLLQIIKEGEITKQIEGITTDITIKLMKKFEELKLAIADVLESISSVKTVVENIYLSVTDYIMSFDVDGDGTLSDTEKEKLRDDIIQKISTFIYDTIGETLLAVGSVFGLVTVASIMSKIGGLKLTPALAAGAPGAVGLFGTAALIALAAAGVYKGYENINSAINNAIDKETGELDNSQFVANLIGGKNEEGGMLNAAINTFDKGLIGLSAGAIIGFLIGGPPGAILGARIGAMAGSVIGAIGGFIGSNEIESTLSQMEQNYKDNTDAIMSFVTGDPTAYSMDIARLTNDLTTTQTALAKAREEGQPDFVIRGLEKQEAKLLKMIEEAPLLIEQQRNENIEKLTEQITAEQAKQSTMQSVLDNPMLTNQDTLENYRKMILESQLKEEELKEKRQELINNSNDETDLSSVIPNIPGGIATATLTSNRISELNAGDVKSNAPGGVVTKIDNSNTAIKGGDNITVTGLSSENSELTALLLASRKARMA